MVDSGISRLIDRLIGLPSWQYFGGSGILALVTNHCITGISGFALLCSISYLSLFVVEFSLQDLFK